MKMLARILVALTGAVSVLTTLGLWFDPMTVASRIGLTSNGIVGNATLRADLGGIFLGIGIFALMGALRQSRMWLLGALVLMGSAFAGRVVGVLMGAAGPGIFEPMAIELVAMAIMVWARALWRAPAPEGL